MKFWIVSIMRQGYCDFDLAERVDGCALATRMEKWSASKAEQTAATATTSPLIHLMA
jgi:hypothetical protein